MPIFEFRCMHCDHCFEILFKSPNDTIELKCEKCASTELERVVSKTNFVVTGGGPSRQAASTTRACSSGSCTTYDIPGPR